MNNGGKKAEIGRILPGFNLSTEAQEAIKGLTPEEIILFRSQLTTVVFADSNRGLFAIAAEYAGTGISVTLRQVQEALQGMQN